MMIVTNILFIDRFVINMYLSLVGINQLSNQLDEKPTLNKAIIIIVAGIMICQSRATACSTENTTVYIDGHK